MRREKGEESWNRIWSQTDSVWFEEEAFIAEVFKRFESTTSFRSPLLDVGCGRGIFLDFVGRRPGFAAYGTDFSLDSLRHCQTPCALADCGTLPFSSNRFGAVTCILLIEHVPHYEHFLTEAARILMPGGCLYLLFPNFYSIVTPVLFIRRRLLDKRNIPYHRPLWDREVKEKLEAMNFGIVSVQFMSIAHYRKGLERVIGSAAGLVLPERFKEEVIIVCEKR